MRRTLSTNTRSQYLRALDATPPAHSNRHRSIARGLTGRVLEWAHGWPALLIAFAGPAVPAFSQAFVAEWTASANGGVGPTGTALATEGGTTYLYVSDHPRGRIIKFNAATGAVAATFGTVGSGNGQFNQPYGIAIERTTGDLYVAERGNNRVQRITNTGTFVMAWGTAGNAAGQLAEPIGIALDAAGDVYVAEHVNNRVQKFHVTQSGGTWTAASVAMWGSQGSGTGQFSNPYGMTIDAAGNVWVADGLNGRVQRFNTSGVYQSTLGGPGTAAGQFVVATGVTTDASGTVYVTSTNSDPQNSAAADASSQWVSKFSAAGAFVSRWGGTYGSGPGEFRLPFSVAVDAANRAYVADYYNTRVQVFDLSAAPGTGAPTVSAFTVGSNTATSVTYQLTFSKPVTGVDSGDFTTVMTGGATATVGSVTGSGASYSIPVSFTGTGTVQLNLKPSGTGIADLGGTALAGGATGPVYTIGGGGSTDTTPPTVASFTIGASSATSLTLQLSFSENVAGVDRTDFTSVTTGGATATIGTVSGSGSSYTIPVTMTGTGTVQVNLNASGTGIADTSGNALAGGATGPVFTIPSGGGATGTHVVTIDVPANGTYAAGQMLTFTVNFSAPVTASTGGEGAKGGKADDDEGDVQAPFFTWTAVGTTGDHTSGQVTYVSGSGSTALKFAYQVRPGDSAPKGISLGTSIQLPKGSGLKDAAGNALAGAALALPWTTNPLGGVILNGGTPGGDKGTGPVVVIKRGDGLLAGQPFTLPATTSSGQPITWVLVSGNATLNGNVLTPKNKGAVVVRAIVAGGTSSSSAATDFEIQGEDEAKTAQANGDTAHRDRLSNLSSRLQVSSSDATRTAIAGFVVTGRSAKQVLIRAVGPGLAAFGVKDAVAGARLQLHNQSGAVIAQNDSWNGDAAIAAAEDRVGAFKLAAGSRDSALLLTLSPGAYTAEVGANDSGTALLEVYDATGAAVASTEEIINISTRGFVDTGDGNLIAGFVVGGDAPKRVLVRGIGASLAGFGVAGALADPTLALYTAGGATVLARNDNWETPQTASAATPASAADIMAATRATGAFPLAAGSKDAVILITLMPGSYSAVVSGVNRTTGAGLVEVYEVPNP